MSISLAPAAYGQPTTESVSRVALRADSIALIVNTRNHNPSALIPTLVRNGFTSAERPLSEAINFVRRLRPGLVVAIVDPERPDGLDAIHLVAQSGAYTVVLAPSAAGFASALEAGADVCLPDQAGEAALVAQIGAVRRRLDRAAELPESHLELAVGDFRLDLSSHRLHQGATQIPLTAMEFSILAHLAENSGKATSAVELLHHVTGRLYGDSEAAQTVKVYIRRLRQKLQNFGGAADIIVTVRGYGYMVERRLPALS